MPQPECAYRSIRLSETKATTTKSLTKFPKVKITEVVEAYHWPVVTGTISTLLLAQVVPLRAQQPTAWKDLSPHVSRFIPVGQDVRLEELSGRNGAYELLESELSLLQVHVVWRHLDYLRLASPGTRAGT